jgi:hypothetical protein
MSEREGPSRSEGWARSHDGDPWRSSEALYDHGSVYDVLVDLIQGGFAQIALLALPALWIVAGIPVYAVEMSAAAVVAVAWTTLLLTAFRGGRLTVGRPWPVLTNQRFGTTGWRAFLTRSVHLSAMVLVVVPTSALAQVVTGSGLANALVAVVLSTVGVALVPYLDGSSPRVRLARFCWTALGLCLAGGLLLVAATDAPPVGAIAGPVVFGLAAFDARPIDALRRIRPTSNRPDGRR